MFKEALASADLSVWPAAALVIFFMFMTGVFLWILRPRAKETYAAAARLALDDTRRSGHE